MQYKIIETAATAGTVKATRPLKRLFALSVMAGAFIGLGGLLSLYLGYGFPGITAANPGLQRLLSALAFPLGLFLIVMFGADLFTGNNALLMPAVAARKIGWADVVRNWTLVWLGNFVGCLLFVLLFVGLSDMFAVPCYREAAASIATAKMALPPLTVFFRGIAANWCVCLAVWLGLGVSGIGAKALACWLPVAAFVALGYEHCIANMFFIPAGIVAGAPCDLGAIALNLLVATAGNIVGGALFVGHLLTRLYKR